METNNKIVTLINANKMQMKNETVECPCCFNGSMVLKSNEKIDEKEFLTFECVSCHSVLTVPYIRIEEDESR